MTPNPQSGGHISKSYKALILQDTFLRDRWYIEKTANIHFSALNILVFCYKA